MSELTFMSLINAVRNKKSEAVDCEATTAPAPEVPPDPVDEGEGEESICTDDEEAFKAFAQWVRDLKGYQGTESISLRKSLHFIPVKTQIRATKRLNCPDKRLLQVSRMIKKSIIPLKAIPYIVAIAEGGSKQQKMMVGAPYIIEALFEGYLSTQNP